MSSNSVHRTNDEIAIESREEYPFASARGASSRRQQSRHPRPSPDLVNAEVERLAKLFGKITTSEEVAKASQYSDPMAKGDRGRIQKAAFNIYALETCDFDRVSAELNIYRLIGESSAYFGLLGKEVEIEGIQELSLIIRGWVILEARGSPNLLVEGGFDEASPAARLKKYMKTYKSQKGINKWTVDSLNSMRFSISQALSNHARQNNALQKAREDGGK